MVFVISFGIGNYNYCMIRASYSTFSPYVERLFHNMWLRKHRHNISGLKVLHSVTQWKLLPIQADINQFNIQFFTKTCNTHSYQLFKRTCAYNIDTSYWDSCPFTFNNCSCLTLLSAITGYKWKSKTDKPVLRLWKTIWYTTLL